MAWVVFRRSLAQMPDSSATDTQRQPG